MQIVIEIDDNLYKSIKNNGYIYEEEVEEVALSIIGGTPLPKGHGRLIDADNIKTAFPGGEYVRTESVRATIEHEETIIEEDKAESEDKE